MHSILGRCVAALLVLATGVDNAALRSDEANEDFNDMGPLGTGRQLVAVKTVMPVKLSFPDPKLQLLEEEFIKLEAKAKQNDVEIKRLLGAVQLLVKQRPTTRASVLPADFLVDISREINHGDGISDEEEGVTTEEARSDDTSSDSSSDSNSKNRPMETARQDNAEGATDAALDGTTRSGTDGPREDSEKKGTTRNNAGSTATAALPEHHRGGSTGATATEESVRADGGPSTTGVVEKRITTERLDFETDVKTVAPQ